MLIMYVYVLRMTTLWTLPQFGSRGDDLQAFIEDGYGLTLEYFLIKSVL